MFGTFAPGLNISGHVSMDLSIGGDEKEKCVLTQTGDVSIRDLMTHLIEIVAVMMLQEIRMSMFGELARCG